MPTITTTNPATGHTLASYPSTGAAEIEAVLDAAVRARTDWARASVADRAKVLQSIAEALRRHRDGPARLVTAEIGKPIREARAEVDKCALACEHYAEHAVAFLTAERVAADRWIRYRSLGTVLAVMPWNFPLWPVIRAGVAALAAGNAVVLKHAANATGCAVALRDIMSAACLRPGCRRACSPCWSSPMRTCRPPSSD